MKHPLTSKERRGLVAVAAAALLCIGSGFAFRSCRSHAPHRDVVVVDGDPEAVDSISEKSKKSEKSEIGSNGKRSRREKRGKTEKSYPSRSPLDEPIN